MVATVPLSFQIVNDYTPVRSIPDSKLLHTWAPESLNL
ncbi:hypothetical protein SAMN05444162_4481 [Paenibacillaceae bacterium GAS479]|nr:hypothetical protein SAMN05444162_4481 [Paenibacillaceae bacterium GAS479]